MHKAKNLYTFYQQSRNAVQIQAFALYIITEV